MEPNNTIEGTIDKIIQLLTASGEEYWTDYFTYQKNRLINQDDSRQEISKDLLKAFKGGMGSFSDLVLHKNSVPLIDENNQLEILKDNLFDLCEDEI